MSDRLTVDTITSDQLDALYAERDEHKQDYLKACATIAAMHKAAVGEVRGPDRGVVEDVEDVRLRAERAEAERDGAYRERAHLLAWLAVRHEAVLAPAPDVEEPGWQILYLYATAWQMSWHISPRDAELFDHVERVAADHPRAQWDGHTTEQKYAHIRNYVRALHRSALDEPKEG